jgi:hypothetical protein
MGSGGSQTLWSPSYEAGVERKKSRNRATNIFGHHLAEKTDIFDIPAGLTMMVGFYKREQSN